MSPPAAKIRATILELTHARGPRKSICPSEAARMLDSDWRPLMAAVRKAGRQLAAEGLVEVTQRGAVVDAENVSGPIRYRIKK